MQKITKFLSLFSLLFISFSVHASAPSFYAGTAWTDITPPVGSPLGGLGDMDRRMKYLVDWLGQTKYTTFFAPSKGRLDGIRSKAFVIKNENRTSVFISLDVVGINASFYDKVNSLLKPLGFDDVFISATHTHSGPGALSDSWFWEILAMDKFNKTLYNNFLQGVLLSVEKAYAALEPAELYATSFNAKELHHNRRGHADHMDNKANLLLAKASDGRWLGGIANYAIHGTVFDSDNLFFSADAPGGLERGLERVLSTTGSSKKPTIIFINGAEGDVSPSYDDGMAGIERAGAEFGELALNALPLARKVQPVWDVKHGQVTLAKGRLNLAKCGIKIAGKPLNMKIGIGKRALPRVANVWQIHIDDITMMSWPGEPTTYVGDTTKALAVGHGYNDVWIMGLTNGHMGYFTTRDEYVEGGYEPCMTLHGPSASERILGVHERLLDPNQAVTF